ncbi:MAG: hypothetical protein WKF65_08610 [Gaiellaceae bacterium]
MRVNVYVDGFNVYRGGAEIAGSGTVGWKWLDFRAMAATIAAAEWPNGPHSIERVVYCTARVNPTPMDPDLPLRQESFLNALLASGSVDWVEYGLFLDKVKTRPLALRGTGRKRKPVIVTARPPVLVKDANDQRVTDAVFMVTVADREEKGSDVNVATHLLLDALAAPPTMDAAMVFSNDSDLKLPVAKIRLRLPVGIVNPGRGYTAGALHHDPATDVAGQWERQLTFADFSSHQLSDPVGAYAKPPSW